MQITANTENLCIKGIFGEKTFDTPDARWAISDEYLAISSKGKFLVISSTTGEIIWQRNFTAFTGYARLTKPCFADGKLFLGAGKPSSKLYAFEPSTGAEIWIKPLLTGEPDGPALFSNLIVFMGKGKVAYAYELETGKTAFEYRITGNIENMLPTGADEFLYLTHSGGEIIKLNTEGKVEKTWSFFTDRPKLNQLHKDALNGKLDKGFDTRCLFGELSIEDDIVSGEVMFAGEQYSFMVKI